MSAACELGVAKDKHLRSTNQFSGIRAGLPSKRLQTHRDSLQRALLVEITATAILKPPGHLTDPKSFVIGRSFSSVGPPVRARPPVLLQSDIIAVRAWPSLRWKNGQLF